MAVLLLVIDDVSGLEQTLKCFNSSCRSKIIKLSFEFEYTFYSINPTLAASLQPAWPVIRGALIILKIHWIAVTRAAVVVAEKGNNSNRHSHICTNKLID